MTTTSPTLPPDLVAAAAEALAACEDWNYEFPGVEARAEKLAEAALRAADAPGLLAEIERLRGSIAVEKKWRKDADDRAEKMLAENEQFRVSASQLRWLGELPADERARLVKIYFGDFTKIEQERDEARQLATESAKEHWITLRETERVTKELATALAQRDEAQRAAALHCDLDNFNHALLEKARAEIEQLRTEQADNLRAAQSIAAELVAQRDEARKALATVDDLAKCRTHWQGYPGWTTCLDVARIAEESPDKYSAEYRQAISETEDHMCVFCKIRKQARRVLGKESDGSMHSNSNGYEFAAKEVEAAHKRLMGDGA